MSRTKLLFLIAFLLVFGAGAVLGAAAIIGRGGPPHDKRGGGPLAHLNLSGEQEQQMRAIWSQVMDEQRPQFDQRRKSIEQQRQQAFMDLLSSDQKARYDELAAKFDAEMAAVGEEQGKVFRDAQERTRQLLNEQQRASYDDWLSKREWGRGRGRDRDRHEWGRGPTTAPATAPTTAPAI